MKLSDIAQKIDEAKLECRWCGSLLLSKSICHYSHEGGIQLDDYNEPQWVYINCTRCGYNWALWKLQHQIKVKVDAS